MTDDVMADLAAMYQQALPPVEPVKFTRDQLDWLKAHLAPPAPRPYGLPDPAALFGLPIHIVDTVEESTPCLKGWIGWEVDTTGDREDYSWTQDPHPRWESRWVRAWRAVRARMRRHRKPPKGWPW